jgi:hypothetical protein
MTEPTPTWHALCSDHGHMRACNGCARNPLNQPEAAAARAQRWERPTIASDGRCADWMARRQG